MVRLRSNTIFGNRQRQGDTVSATNATHSTEVSAHSVVELNERQRGKPVRSKQGRLELRGIALKHTGECRAVSMGACSTSASGRAAMNIAVSCCS